MQKLSMTRRLLAGAGASLVLGLACTGTAMARPLLHHGHARARHATPVAPRAVVAPTGVYLSPGDSWREVADAPPSPPLGPATPASGVGGSFPSAERGGKQPHSS